MAKTLKVFGKYKKEGYSLLIELKGQDDCLLIYGNNAIEKISSNSPELAAVRGEYDHICSGNAILGNLTLIPDTLHYLCVVTQSSSVGEFIIIFFLW